MVGGMPMLADGAGVEPSQGRWQTSTTRDDHADHPSSLVVSGL